MFILRTVAEMQAWRDSIEKKALAESRSVTVGFVPTMGALHAGHLSLVQQSRATNELTVVSIFVNPLQFGPNEDLAKYPRPFDRDVELLREANADALFAPTHAEFYEPDHSTYVVEETVGLPLCGESRPGHFRGVTTVVLKLFNVVRPTAAYFGQKDGQQCAVIERMVRDLAVPVRIFRGAIVRENDGLAMSSRNIYLSPAERALAPRIFASLQRAASAYQSGTKSGAEIELAGRTYLEQALEFRVQYYELRDSQTLARIVELTDKNAGAYLAVATYLGKTRLIDNLVIQAP